MVIRSLGRVRWSDKELLGSCPINCRGPQWCWRLALHEKEQLCWSVVAVHVRFSRKLQVCFSFLLDNFRRKICIRSKLFYVTTFVSSMGFKMLLEATVFLKPWPIFITTLNLGQKIERLANFVESKRQFFVQLWLKIASLIWESFFKLDKDWAPTSDQQQVLGINLTSECLYVLVAAKWTCCCREWSLKVAFS